jgi:hypothetical protein
MNIGKSLQPTLQLNKNMKRKVTDQAIAKLDAIDRFLRRCNQRRVADQTTAKLDAIDRFLRRCNIGFYCYGRSIPKTDQKSRTFYIQLF